MRRVLTCLVATAALGLVAGMAGSAASGPPPHAAGGPCSLSAGRPVAASKVASVLRRYGFHLYPDSLGSCSSRLVAQLVNVVYSGPHENLDRRNEITAREGDLFCDVYRRPRAGVTTRHPTTLFQFSLPDPTDKGAWLLLGNVDCSLFTDRPAIVKRLRAGMRAIQKGLPRPATRG
ncbi:MAG TPA: hypothetical protein VF101_14635 [Gaiellaceae bacterium]